MKFNKLNEKAKKVAVNDYIKGWKETHPEEKLTFEETKILCTCINDEVTYTKTGKVKE